ncbi:MAG: GNAT family N-acetyltransferase [Defluviitaleaceae bacterium]|nr:GNAT family N-acetyltransferase [Defluviitaleaceae bacterium]
MITTKWSFGECGIDDALRIRRAVFIEEQGIAESDEMDGTDRSCAHFVAYGDDGEPAATGRILITNDTFFIGRVAVLAKLRGQGYGTLVMNTLIDACHMMGGESQTVHAQTSAIKFYEKLGFRRVGGVFAEAGIDHVTMVREGGPRGCACRAPRDGGCDEA